MKTFQDLQSITDEESKRQFIFSAVTEYKSGDIFHWAVEGDLYQRQLNSAIMKFKKLLYKITGEAVPDNFTANHKCASNFFDRFVTQEVQYLLSNGVTFEDDTMKDRLGTKRKPFDNQLQKAAEYSLAQGVSFGFFNLDHLDVFEAKEFCPLWDEEDGSLKAGIRFWQIDFNKPIRFTLYEIDGYTEYIKKSGGDVEVLRDKRPYKLKTRSTPIDGLEIYDGENYPDFPIVPLWGNKKHQSELVGIKSEIDAYDLIKSGFANDLDDASMIYWTLENAGGMDDIDLVKFIEHLKTVRAAVLENEGAKAEAHTIEVPYQSRETYLTRLADDLYKDAMALDVSTIAAGNVTATAIRAAYQDLDNKCDGFEYCICDFIQEIFALIGVDDNPTFNRSRIANMAEETTMVISAAQYLDTETILKHLPFISSDEVKEIMENVAREEVERYETDEQPESEEESGSETNPDGKEAEKDVPAAGSGKGAAKVSE